MVKYPWRRGHLAENFGLPVRNFVPLRGQIHWQNIIKKMPWWRRTWPKSTSISPQLCLTFPHAVTLPGGGTAQKRHHRTVERVGARLVICSLRLSLAGASIATSRETEAVLVGSHGNGNYVEMWNILHNGVGRTCY